MERNAFIAITAAALMFGAVVVAVNWPGRTETAPIYHVVETTRDSAAGYTTEVHAEASGSYIRYVNPSGDEWVTRADYLTRPIAIRQVAYGWNESTAAGDLCAERHFPPDRIRSSTVFGVAAIMDPAATSTPSTWGTVCVWVSGTGVRFNGSSANSDLTDYIGPTTLAVSGVTGRVWRGAPGGYHQRGDAFDADLRSGIDIYLSSDP